MRPKLTSGMTVSQFLTCITVILIFITVSFVFASSYVFHTLKTCMTVNLFASNENETIAFTDIEFDDSTDTDSTAWLTLALGMGLCLGAVCAVYNQTTKLIYLFIGFGCLSGVTTLLAGVIDNFIVLFILRLFHGICLSGIFITAVTTCKTQSSFIFYIFLSVIYIPLYLIILNPIIGAICPSLWITNFIFGIIIIFLSCVSTLLLYCNTKNANENSTRVSKIMFRSFITDNITLSLIISMFGTLFGSQFIIHFAPMFLSYTHGLASSTIGWFSSLLYILTVTAAVFVTFASTLNPNLTTLLSFMSFILIELLPQDIPWMSIVFLFLIYVASSSNVSCCLQQFPLISDQNLVFTAVTFCFLNGLVIIILSAAVVTTTSNWQAVFIVISIIMIICLCLSQVLRHCYISMEADFELSNSKPELNIEQPEATKGRPKQGVIVTLERAVSACKVVSDRLHIVSIKPAESPDYNGPKTVSFIHGQRPSAV